MSGAGIYIKTPSGLVAAATVPGTPGSQGPQSSLVPGTITTGAAGSNAAATITGAGPVQTLNLTLPKGDPGGLVASAVLAAPDLNTMTTLGLYYITGAHTNSASAGESHVEVFGPSFNTLAQMQTVGATGRIFRRTRSGGAWTPWLELVTKGSIGSGDLTGTGSPEGVVTAPVGTYYTDTALTNGAMRWAKKTGTGNTGWTVVDGNTGWRNVSSWLANGWALHATGGHFYILRVDNVIFIQASLSGAAATSQVVTSAFVAGWRGGKSIPPSANNLPANNGYGAFLEMHYNPPLATLRTDVTTYTTTHSLVRLAGSMPAADPWPTTLPGTAV